MNPVFEEFIRSHGYNDVAKLKDADPGEPFPRGTLELKSSWKVVAPGEDAGTYFTTQAPVPLLVQNGTKVEIDPVKTKTETLALVGLHVVGVTEGHPEFIWATFEHKDNAPDRPDALAPDSSQPIDDTRGWTFYPKGKPAKDCNINPRSAVKLADPDKQILSPTVPIFRHFAFGGDDDPSTIVSLNESVHKQLPPKRSVWRNYDLKGATWLEKPARDFEAGVDFTALQAQRPTDKILAGDTKLSNTTMETFTQATQNCFSCHRTTEERIPQSDDAFPAKKITISHILTTAYAEHRQTDARKAKNR
jgi:hypothetical protein